MISDAGNGNNTSVTTVPLGARQAASVFPTLVQPGVTVGTFQQATLVGDYPSVSGVLLSSSEPGVDPAMFAVPVYVSSNPNVARIDANGLVTAVGAGTATLTASVGALAGTNSVTITVTPVVPNLVHRYSFTNATATAAVDSISGVNGTLNGTASFNSSGQLMLGRHRGILRRICRPASLSNLDEVTIETPGDVPGHHQRIWLICLPLAFRHGHHGLRSQY